MLIVKVGILDSGHRLERFKLNCRRICAVMVVSPSPPLESSGGEGPGRGGYTFSGIDLASAVLSVKSGVKTFVVRGVIGITPVNWRAPVASSPRPMIITPHPISAHPSISAVCHLDVRSSVDSYSPLLNYRHRGCGCVHDLNWLSRRSTCRR